MKMKMKMKIPTKRTIIIFCGILIAVIGTGFYIRSERSNDAAQIIQGPNTEEPVNYDPPTEQEKQETANHKDSFFKQEEDAKNRQQPTTSNKVQVTPIITSVEQRNNQIEVSAYVPSIFEDNGNCSAVFTMGSQSIAKTSLGTKEGSSVYCPLISAPVAEFPTKGKWTVVLNYTSNYANGSSKPVEFEIK